MLFLIAAYLLSAVVGWYVGTAEEKVEAEDEVSLSTRSGGGREKRRDSGVELVKSWASDLEGVKNLGPSLNLNHRNSYYEEVLDSLEPSDAPEEELMLSLQVFQSIIDGWKGTPEDLKQMRRQQAVTGARWAQWMMVDPEAAFAAMENPGEESGMRRVGFYDSITALYLRDHGIDEALGLLQGRKGGFVDRMRHKLAGEIAKKSDVSDVKILLKSFEEDDFQSKKVVDVLARQWDLDRREDLLSLFREDGIPSSMIQSLAGRMDKSELVPWFRELAADEKLDQNARSVLAYTALRELKGSGLGLDERIEFTRELFENVGVNHLGDSKGLKTGMVTSGMREFLNSEDDWAYAFRHGVVSTDEVMEAVTGELAEVSEHEKEVRSQLYRHLAEEDPERAMELYEGVDEEGQNWQKIYAMRWWFSDVNPNEFLGVMKDINYEGEEDIQKSLWEGWRKNTGSNLDRFGENYISWVMALPDGIHKGRALQTLAHEGEVRYPGIGLRVQTELEAMRARKGEQE